MSERPALLVIAKAPVAGRVKTRLAPPLTHREAASLAEAALADTLAAVARTPVPRRVLVLEGEPGPWLPTGFEVLPQRGDGLAERLGWAFADAGGSALLVGMDTPQLSAELLDRALAELSGPGIGAVLGPAADGGYWAIGLRRPDPRVFAGVPMSTSSTAAAQRRRLESLSLRWRELPGLRDVDTFADARMVAQQAPRSRFAQSFARMAARTR